MLLLVLVLVCSLLTSMTCQTGLLLPEHGYLPALDTMLSKAVASQQDHKSLKQGLGNQEKWENEWEMPFHPDSCVIYSFSPSDQKQDLAPHIVIHSFSPCDQEQDLAPHIHTPLIPVRDSQHYQVHGCHYPERHRMGQTCVVF